MRGLAFTSFVVAALAVGCLAVPESPYYPLYKPHWRAYYAEAFPISSPLVPFDWYVGQWNFTAAEDYLHTPDSCQWEAVDEFGFWNTDNNPADDNADWGSLQFGSTDFGDHDTLLLATNEFQTDFSFLADITIYYDTNSEWFLLNAFVKVDNVVYISEPGSPYDFSYCDWEWVAWNFNQKTKWYNTDWEEVDLPCFGTLEAFGLIVDGSDIEDGDWIVLTNFFIGGYAFDDDEQCYDAVPDFDDQTRICYYQTEDGANFQTWTNQWQHQWIFHTVDSPDGSPNIGSSHYGANSYYNIEGENAYVDCECNWRPLPSRCVRINEARLSTFKRRELYNTYGQGYEAPPALALAGLDFLTAAENDAYLDLCSNWWNLDESVRDELEPECFQTGKRTATTAPSSQREQQRQPRAARGAAPQGRLIHENRRNPEKRSLTHSLAGLENLPKSTKQARPSQ